MKKEDNILVVVKYPGEKSRWAYIPNELKEFQHLVGGYIETVRLTGDVLAIVNEEGVLLDLPENVAGLRGTVVFCSSDGDEFVSLPPDRLVTLLNIL